MSSGGVLLTDDGVVLYTITSQENLSNFQIHHGSSSLLSKLIQQSYHGKMEAVSLTGIAPIQMLLEIGLDKMKKDYVNFFIGKPASC